MPEEVLRNLFRRKEQLEKDGIVTDSNRILLIVPSGMMRGVHAAGQACALAEHGLHACFDRSAGVSAGSTIGPFLAANQPQEGTSIFHEECCRDFFSLWRYVRGRGPIVDTKYLMEVFRNSPQKRLNLEAAYASRTELHVGVTCAETGEGLFLDAKTVKPDLLEAVHASLAVPWASGCVVTIDGRDYIDGAVAFALAAKEAIQKFNPTDVLILANRSNTLGWGEYLTDLAAAQLSFWDFPPAVYESFMQWEDRFNDDLRFLRSEYTARWAIVWATNALGRFTFNAKQLRQTALREKIAFSNLLAEAERSVTALTT